MNPTGQPMGTPMPSAPSGAAKDAVNLPAIFMMVLGGLGGLLFLIALLQRLAGSSADNMAQLQQTLSQLTPDQRQLIQPFVDAAMRMEGAGGIVALVFCVALAGFTVFAGLQMRSLKNWGVALAGAIIVMIPCSSYCCCCLGIPVGIWALIVLNKPEVKSAFS